MICRLYTCLLLAGLCLMANACSDVCNLSEDSFTDTQPPPLPVDTNDCFEDFLYKANVRPAYVRRYAALFRANGLSVDGIVRLSKLELLKLLKCRTFNITHAGDIFKIHKCVQPGGKCLADPFCVNGGKCVYSRSESSHICECPTHYQGVRCERRENDRVAALEECLEKMTCKVKNVGSVYTRWGKNSCEPGNGTSTDAELVYNGYMAGSWYDHRGSGADFQCLPYQPIYSNYRPGVQAHGVMYSTEFETGGTAFEPWKSLDQHDATCSVCRVRKRSTQIMIPATNECPPSWTREYHGYLMTSHHDHHRVQHVCIDANPDAVRGSSADQGGERLYFVETWCGLGIDCPPYVAEKELLCAVCTR